MSHKQCPNCEGTYDKLGLHWNRGCSYPSFSDMQLEILTGLLMGDGTVVRGTNPSIRAHMTNKEYLEFLDNIFGVLGCGIRLHEEHSNKDWSNTYTWQTRAHPYLSKYEDWYSSGRKVWPEDIELTPLVLKHWYAGDGCLEVRGNSVRASIALTNEMGNGDKVIGMFNSAGVVEPNWYENGTMASIRWTVEDTYELFKYMGEPLPGFESKWPNAR